MHSSPAGDFVFGSIELGNDGGLPCTSWVANVRFPEGATIRSFSSTPGLQFTDSSPQANTPTRTIQYTGPGDTFNPGDKILIQYVLDRPGQVNVAFKGVGSTASQRPPEQSRNTPSIISTAANSIAILGFVISISGILIYYMYSRKDILFRKQCAAHCADTLGQLREQLQETAHRHIAETLLNRIEDAPPESRPALICFLQNLAKSPPKE